MSRYDQFFSNFHWTEFEKVFVGLDSVINTLDGARNYVASSSYPPHDLIQVDEGHYRVVMALAGFGKADIEVKLEKHPNRLLSIRSVSHEQVDGDGEKKSTEEVLWKGIGDRHFHKTLPLADGMEVKKCQMKDGILTVDLEMVVAEDEKPQTFKVE